MLRRNRRECALVRPSHADVVNIAIQSKIAHKICTTNTISSIQRHSDNYIECICVIA